MGALHTDAVGGAGCRATVAAMRAPGDVFALPDRRCAGEGCGTRLRRSNPGALCGVCQRRAAELAIAEKDRAGVAKRLVSERERKKREYRERAAMTKAAGANTTPPRSFPKAGRTVAAKRPARAMVNDLDPLPPARMCKFGCGLPVHLGKCKGPARFAAADVIAGANGSSVPVYRPGPRQAVAEIPSGARGAAERYREQDYATCVIPLAEVPVATRPGRPPDPIAASRIEALWAKVERLELGKVLVVTCASSTEARSLVRRMRSRATIARACIRARRTAFDCYFWRVGE